MKLYLAVANGRLACITETYSEVVPYGLSQYAVYEIEAFPLSLEPPVEEPEVVAPDPEAEIESGE